VFGDLVDDANVGMIEGRGGTSFALEPRKRLRAPQKRLGQELQGHLALKAQVESFVHHAHPATAELFLDSVVRDGLADHRCDVTRTRKSSGR